MLVWLGLAFSDVVFGLELGLKSEYPVFSSTSFGVRLVCWWVGVVWMDGEDETRGEGVERTCAREGRIDLPGV